MRPECSAMKFLECIEQKLRMVYDGPMETRIEYGTNLKLDKEMSIFALCDSAEGREALAGLYRRDIEAVRPLAVPLILNAPTYRASSAHAIRMGYTMPDAILHINRVSLDLVNSLKAEYQGSPIYVTAPVGPKYAGYHPDVEFDLEEATQYHLPQAQVLGSLGPDLISIAAMPGAIEAQGAARAVAATGLPYTVGFILNQDGNLLDGVSPEDLILAIDSTVDPRPLFYVIGCTHPSVCARALQRQSPQLARIQGIKANGSSLTPAELLALNRAVADDPEEFAQELLRLGLPRDFRVYGGCCGTDTAHLECLARRIAALP